MPVRARLPLLAMGALSLLWALWLGLVRMGAAPALGPVSVLDHGPLMVSGFLGTVIALERAVAANRLWGYSAPLFCGAGSLLLLLGQPAPGAVALALGSAVVLVILAQVVKGDPSLHHNVMALSAVAWLAGNALFALGRPVFDVVPFWLVFLVGTISSERLELNRLLPRTALTRSTFLFGLLLVVAGAVATLFARDLGMRLFGAGALALSAWMFRYDVARRTIRQKGATRFIAASLLSGYAWLGVSGVLALLFGHPVAGPRYDALLHSVFVGFVFSMIFGHALVILPAVVGARVEWRTRFYLHLALLHASLLARLAGDLANVPVLRQAGAWVNASAILLFIASTALAVVRKKAATSSPPAPRQWSARSRPAAPPR